jgi:hypothetical protein
MKIWRWLIVLAIPIFGAGVAHAQTGLSYVGTLASPENIFAQSFTLSSASTVEIQTYGFGGGTNFAGQAIPAGGFDPLVALFSGSATAATILTDGFGDPIATADNLSNPYALIFAACPPAGTVTVGTVPDVCGDDNLVANLAAGTYTLLLTDANFVPIPVNPGIASPVDLTDTSSANYGSSTNNGAYTDLSGGVFQTCASYTDCNTDTGNFAVDILDETPGSTLSPTPEPASLVLWITGLAGVGWRVRPRVRRKAARS